MKMCPRQGPRGTPKGWPLCRRRGHPERVTGTGSKGTPKGWPLHGRRGSPRRETWSRLPGTPRMCDPYSHEARGGAPWRGAWGRLQGAPQRDGPASGRRGTLKVCLEQASNCLPKELPLPGIGGPDRRVAWDWLQGAPRGSGPSFGEEGYPKGLHGACNNGHREVVAPPQERRRTPTRSPGEAPRGTN